MAGLSTITVDLAGGEVVLGDRRVVLTAVPDAPSGAATRSTARFQLDDGAVVRLIGFGERSRLVRDALADDNPPRALLTLLRAAAHQGPGGSLADAVLLAIAGGAEQAPEFDRCAVEASRLQAWSWLSVHDAPAIVVDRVVSNPREPEPSGGWTRFVFPGGGTRELEALVDEMVASLLTRGAPIGSEAAEHLEDAPLREAAPMPVDSRSAVARSSRRARMPLSHRTATDDVAGATSATDAGSDPAIGSSTASAGDRPASAIRGSRRTPSPRERRTTAPGTASVAAPVPSRRLWPPATGPAPMPRRAPTPFPVRSIAGSRPGEHGPVSRSLPVRAGVDGPPASEAAVPALVLPGAATPITSDARSASATSRPIPGGAGEDLMAHQRAPLGAARATATLYSADLLDEIAHALAVECDLRGIDA
jgi:hypothetical protein